MAGSVPPTPDVSANNRHSPDVEGNPLPVRSQFVVAVGRSGSLKERCWALARACDIELTPAIIDATGRISVRMPERRNILITGASAGLGARMAHEFAARGRNLALCARRGEQLAQVRSELLHAHPGITIAVAELDVNEHDQVFAVFRRFRDELGGLDRVIVNAGVGEGRSIGTGGFDRNLRIANTNFVAALAQCEAAMEIFRAQKRGHLVVISSIAAMRGLP